MASVNNVKGEKFIFTIKNTTGARLVIAILAAFFDTKDSAAPFMHNKAAQIVSAGYACDAVIDDGTIAGAGATICTVKSSNSKKTIRAFREYIKQNSRALKGMSVQTNNLTAFNETLEIIECNPLLGDRQSYVPMVALRDGMSNLNDVISLDGDGLVLGFDTLMLLPVNEGHELTVTFWF